MTLLEQPAHPDGNQPAPVAAVPSAGRYATKAVLALMLGIVSLVLLLPASLIALLAAIAAVTLGHLAIREVRITGERGREVAIGGLVTGYLSLAVMSVILLLAIGVGATATGSGTLPDACTSKTGNFTHKQLQACFDQTNGN